MRMLNEWFLKNKRSFPWREKITPYRVWVSEVMLQQTRALVVIPYFERWMALFPDVKSLAAAPIEQVIKVWEGLGYYSRARNLHAGAQQILKEFGGEIPSTQEELLRIRGLGPYTSAAILSFGFQKRAAAVDGNVLRVAARYLWIAEDIAKSGVKKKVAEQVETLLDQDKPWITSEALIELGATICLPKPRCSECPIRRDCKAALQSNPELLPIKTKIEKVEKLIRGVALIEADGSLLVRKNKPGQIMADLFEFPYFEGVSTPKAVQKEVERLVVQEVEWVEKLPLVQHSFTRYQAKLVPFYYRLDQKVELEGWEWVSIDELVKLPFSSGHRKILIERCNFWRSCGFLKAYEYSPS